MESLSILTDDVLKLLESNNLLNSLIQRLLLKDLLSKVKLDNKELSIIKNQFFKEKNLKNEEEFTALMNKNNKSEEEMLNDLSQSIKLKKYCDLNFKSRTNAHFLERKSSLDKVVYSLIRLKDRYLANEIHQRLCENESEFGELAKEFSEGFEKYTSLYPLYFIQLRQSFKYDFIKFLISLGTFI